MNEELFGGIRRRLVRVGRAGEGSLIDMFEKGASPE
jgi:hypothetical protein